MPKILVVGSGHAFSTSDVGAGLVWGLQHAGCDVIEYPLADYLLLAEALIEAAGKALPYEQNPSFLATAEVLGYAIRHEPDAVIVVSGNNFHIARAVLLQMLGSQRTKPMPTAILCTESPYDEREIGHSRGFDYVFTNERTAIQQFTRFHQPARVHYLAHAYHPARHMPGPPEPDKTSDVCFIGTGFPERQQLFGGVNWTDLAFVQRGYGWQSWTPGDEQSITQNDDTADYYRSTKVAVNHHRTTTTLEAGTHIAPGAAESIGPRAYEIAACGAFQLCDDSRVELRDVFGDTVPTYRADDSADLDRHVRYWLNHAGAREAAATAQHQAVTEHHWGNRANQVLNVLLNA